MDILVTDRLFIIGLTELFRRQMKDHEINTLLPLAQKVCSILGLTPVNIPLEGYYADSPTLSQYFRLIRALQMAPSSEARKVSSTDAFRRLLAAYQSPAMGRIEDTPFLFPRTTSPLGEALKEPHTWSIQGLTQRSQQLIRDSDAGLIAVACASADPVAICVARETMALAADVEFADLEPPRFLWKVSRDVAEVARRFITATAVSFGFTLPDPVEASAPVYGAASAGLDLAGRCILIGEHPGSEYGRYHWYLSGQDTGMVVIDFWSLATWTTADFSQLPRDRWPTSGSKVGSPDQPGRTAVANKGEVPEKKGWLAQLFGQSKD